MFVYLRYGGTDLGGLAKLLLTDIALYLYLIQRHLQGIGMDLRVRELFTGLGDRRVSASAIAHALVDEVWVTGFLNPGAL